jgi:hypothetical protein
MNKSSDRDNSNSNSNNRARGLKSHQVHELADAKIKESERLRNALKISKDYEEGGHWKRQEERLRKAVEKESAENSKDNNSNNAEKSRDGRGRGY